MIHSMTGYGKAEGLISDSKLIVQLKSLNSKQSDIHIKIPLSFKEKELNYRKLLTKLLGRGKVELIIQYDSSTSSVNHKINEEAYKNYFKQIKTINEELGDSSEDIGLIISRFPDIIINEEEALTEEEWSKVEGIITESSEKLIQFREAEGKKLYADLISHVENIDSYLNEALKFEEERINIVRERLHKNLEESIDKVKIDNDRFEQELVYYMEKYDISEEKVRLKSHCEYFIECMDMPAGQGRKLGFISQEMGREINTLGSKANHSEMQKIVVQMKDELEKIKEQVLNVW